MNFETSDAIIIVDYQIDFCSSGALAVPGSEEILASINKLIKDAHSVGALIIASRDWHPPNHISFKDRGGQWPRHCVQNSLGAQFHPKLQIPPSTIVISKGIDPEEDQYSAFAQLELSNLLNEKHIKRNWICGLALDYCVKNTALDSVKYGFTTLLPTNATKSVVPDEFDKKLYELEKFGVIII